MNCSPMLRETIALIAWFSPATAPWEGVRESVRTPWYPGWKQAYRQFSLKIEHWIYEADGTVPTSVSNLAKYKPSSVLIVLTAGDAR